MKAVLVLENGATFDGISVGVDGEVAGEVVLHTGVVGYQEIMSDPTNAGKIIVFTYPLIGNYGVAQKFYESARVWVPAIVIKEKAELYSNWQAEDSFDNLLRKEGVVAISEVDTRTLAVAIRDHGEMHGIVSTCDTSKRSLLEKLKTRKSRKRDAIREISVKAPTELAPAEGPRTGVPRRIGVLDLGMLRSFLKQLAALRCHVTLLPYDTKAEAILGLGLDALIVSNGPEDDQALPVIVAEVRKLVGKIPLLGIATGHQVLCLALGGKLNRMKVGHRGVNYPVRAPSSFKGEITVQNHSFTVDEASIADKLAVTLRNVNDETVEEVASTELRILSTQYYPTSPGLEGEFGSGTVLVNNAFVRFLDMIEKGN